jgi:uncharacterized repeat protein (TIGR01451 family)
MCKGRAFVLLLALACAGFAWSTQASAQTTAAKPPKAAASRAAPSPLTSRFTAQRVDTDKDGKESLESASNVTVGDTIQYTVQHKNISQRRLLQVDFGIPIPPGTSYIEGSAVPEGAKRVRLDARREQMLWRIEKIEPGDVVTLSLRVRIDPDPTLTPAPQEPRKPQLRPTAP